MVRSGGRNAWNKTDKPLNNPKRRKNRGKTLQQSTTDKVNKSLSRINDRKFEINPKEKIRRGQQQESSNNQRATFDVGTDIDVSTTTLPSEVVTVELIPSGSIEQPEDKITPTDQIRGFPYISITGYTGTPVPVVNPVTGEVVSIRTSPESWSTNPYPRISIIPGDSTVGILTTDPTV